MPEDKKEQDSLDPTKIAVEEKKDFETGNPVDDTEPNVDELETGDNKEPNDTDWQPFVPKDKNTSKNEGDNGSDWESPENNSSDTNELIKPEEAEAVVDGDKKYSKPEPAIVKEEEPKPESFIKPEEEKIPSDENIIDKRTKEFEKFIRDLIAERNEEIEKLQEKIKQLEEENIRLKKELENTREENNNLKRQLEANEFVIANYKNELGSAIISAQNLEKKLQDALRPKKSKYIEQEKVEANI